MKDWLSGWWSLTRITALELLRQRLWLLLLIVITGVVIGITTIEAAAPSEQRKLAVAVVISVIGFVITVLAMLCGAQLVRRDIDTRIGFTIFAKPLPLSAYVWGRWTGLTLWLFIASSALAIVGSIALHSSVEEPVPEFLRIAKPQSVERFDAFSRPQFDTRQALVLAGTPGDFLRVTFTGLAQRDHELRLRSTIRGSLAWQPTSYAEIRVLAASRQDAESVPVVLSSQSPYGATWQDGSAVSGGAIVMRNHDNKTPAFDVDYARLVIPAAAIAADGTCILDIVRLMIVRHYAGIPVTILLLRSLVAAC